MNIYFAGSITSGTEYKSQQKLIVNMLEKFGHQVISKRHAFQLQPETQEGKLTPEDIFRRDLWWILRKSDALVAELSISGYGIGYEVAIANMMGLPILGLVHERIIKTSAFIGGNTFSEYAWSKYSEQTLEKIIGKWLKSLKTYVHQRKGLYIAFEGLNQSGKGTQIGLLVDRLKTAGYPVWQGREPGTTWLGEELRRLVQGQKLDIPVSEAEVSLYMAQRAQLVAKEIKPRLQNNGVVVMDRSDGASLAFQGYGRGQNLLRIAALNGYAVNNLRPDIVVYLDVSDEEINNRGKVKYAEFDRHEHETDDFLRRCRQGYQEILQLEELAPPRTWFPVNAVGTPVEVHERVWRVIEPVLKEKGFK